MGYVVVLAVLVLVVAAAYLVGGWFWSTGFRRTALLPQRPSRAYGVCVEAITPNRIILGADEPRQDIGHPGTLGLSWQGGYGQVTDVEAVTGLQVSRGYRQLTGDLPEPNTEVDLESYAFPDDPGDVDLEYENTTYPTELGPVGAWVIPVLDSSRWSIHVHGWTAERREAIRLLPAFFDSRITSMVIDYRNDPDAPADPSGHYRFGLTEWRDVESAVRYASGRGASEVILVGYSTGGAHIMSFLERSDFADVVVGVVLDSPNIILADAVRHGVRGMRLEPIPVRVGRLMTEFGMWIADLRWGIDWDATNYVQRAGDFLTMPTLVFHGTSDHRIPIAVSRQLEARAETVTLVETPAAGHVMSWNADPERYERHLGKFLRSI